MPQFAFGNSPGPLGDQGIPPATPPSPQQEQDDIHAIKEKYVGDGAEPTTLEDPQVFNLSPGQVQKMFDDPSVVVNSVIVSCSSGTVKVYLKDIGAPLNVAVISPQAGAEAHIIVPSGGAAPQYMLTPVKNRPICIGCDPAAAVNAKGCVTIVRI